MEQFLVVGDIHGCGKTLLKLLKILPNSLPLYSVGDLFDRGIHNDLVFEIIKKENILPVMGNHEWLMLNGYDIDLPMHDNWIKNGGDKTLLNFKNMDSLLDVVEHIREFPLSYKINEFLICHAGVQKKQSLEESKKNVEAEDDDKFFSSILWNRKDVYLPNVFQIYGHSPVEEVYLDDYGMNIDTGCVYKNKLTAVLMPGKKLFQVNYCDE